MKKNLVIYHHPCDDGFGSAYAAWLKFRDDAEYFPTNYGEETPDVKGRFVYILDFSYPKNVMARIFATADGVVWRDHHKSAFDAWAGGIPDDGIYTESRGTINILLDNNKSGAMLSWEYFHPNKVIPPYLMLHIEDNDLWRFKYKNTAAFTQRLRIEPMDFARWHEIATMNEAAYLDFVSDGNVLLQQYNNHVDKIIDMTATPCAVSPLFKGLAANAPYAYASTVGNKLAEKCGTYGLVWYLAKDGKIRCSLRSRGDYDVTGLAKVYGGGGHKNAAGFSLPSLKELAKLLVD